MTDLIPRDAAIAAITLGHTVTQHEKALRAIPTIDPACDHCGVDPAAIREAALREAADYLSNRGHWEAIIAISDLIGEKK